MILSRINTRVSQRRSADMAGRSAAGRVFQCCLRPASMDRRHRAAEPGHSLRPAVPSRLGDDDDEPRHLGTRIGITAVLHSWGSVLTHHPHVHMIVPSGGLSPDGQRRISSRPAFLLPVRVLGKLFRRLFLTKLRALFDADRPVFRRGPAPLADRCAFLRYLASVRSKPWVVYAKPPFAGPKAVLALPVTLYPPRRHLALFVTRAA
ncbi:Putative transposase (plasmid) [Komagataeibacter europaeus]|nr:Putative transposase [Komagataeibacter europaeus]